MGLSVGLSVGSSMGPLVGDCAAIWGSSVGLSVGPSAGLYFGVRRDAVVLWGCSGAVGVHGDAQVMLHGGCTALQAVLQGMQAVL